MQMNHSKMASLGTEESGHQIEEAVVTRLKEESMYGLPHPPPPQKKKKKLAVVERWPLWIVGH